MKRTALDDVLDQIVTYGGYITTRRDLLSYLRKHGTPALNANPKLIDMLVFAPETLIEEGHIPAGLEPFDAESLHLALIGEYPEHQMQTEMLPCA